MLGKKLWLLVVLSAMSAWAVDERPISDVEAWNLGIDYYRAGDVTNALRVLRPLLLSPSHGARAAEMVACLARDQARYETDGAVLPLLEEAAAAAQIALRSDPKSERANRNFTRSLVNLAEMRLSSRVDRVLKEAAGKNPEALLGEGLNEARALFADSATYLTNAPARLVALSDSLSARASRLADTWIAVRELVANSVTNGEQAATIIAQVDRAAAATKAAALAFGDLKASAYSSMSEVESDFTRFHKLVALPPTSLAADMLAQSNAWRNVEAFNSRPWQQEALDYTRSFRGKFPAWARQYEQSAQADTNLPPFTVEDQAAISAAATELEKIQLECCENELPDRQRTALELLERIAKLMPKNGGGSSGQNRQSNSEDKSGKGEKPPANQGEQENDGDSQASADDDKESNGDDSSTAEAREGEEDKIGDQEVEAVLKAAQERNDEYEADKRKKMRKAPLPPNERDW